MPKIFVGLFLGPLIDRLSRKTLIVGSDVVRLVVFGLLPFAHHPGTMIVLAAMSGIADSFFRPAVFAGAPNLVDERELDSATTLLQGTEWLAAAIGPLIAGVARQPFGLAHRLLDERGHVPLLGDAAPPHSRPPSAERAGNLARPLA